MIKNVLNSIYGYSANDSIKEHRQMKKTFTVKMIDHHGHELTLDRVFCIEASPSGFIISGFNRRNNIFALPCYETEKITEVKVNEE